LRTSLQSPPACRPRCGESFCPFVSCRDHSRSTLFCRRHNMADFHRRSILAS
jgi:hypothetical protein